MFRTKICGITSVDDCQVCIDAGAEAIGLNFYPPSTRFLDASETVAAEISQHSQGQLSTVGLWVNTDIKEIVGTAESLNLNYIQLHGDEDPAYIKRLASLLGTKRILKAFRLGRHDAAYILDFVSACEIFGVRLAAIIVDAYDPENYGGTGKTLDWKSFNQLNPLLEGYPLILAGGLSGSNVTEAIQAANPYGIDVASGVESEPGRKDPEKVKAFVANAIAALDA